MAFPRLSSILDHLEYYLFNLKSCVFAKRWVCGTRFEIVKVRWSIWSNRVVQIMGQLCGILPWDILIGTIVIVILIFHVRMILPQPLTRFLHKVCLISGSSWNSGCSPSLRNFFTDLSAKGCYSTEIELLYNLVHNLVKQEHLKFLVVVLKTCFLFKCYMLQVLCPLIYHEEP